ncbi:MAG TPA: glucoamylase family protein [Gemmatimonadales bacterium]|nr:glucoamylase family protein [Gemmatimonadales bacterium]
MVAGPIRGELLGAEHLADRARAVAGGQRLVARGWRRGRPRLLARLDETRRLLDGVHARLAGAADRKADVGPAGEWLLDNFHVVQEHIREVRESLPRGFYRELPELAGGALAGYPRVYELAITLISHTEGRIDPGNLDLFCGAFQQIAPLSIGELWAVPAMLRLGLIESVRRMALRTVQRLDELEEADSQAARLVGAAEHSAAALAAAIDAFVARPPPLTPTFVSRFLHQLRLARGSVPPLTRLAQWIAEEAVGAEDAAARSTQRVALTQIMMANSITSLRAIARVDWRTFVERQSLLDAALRDDPAGAYARMTFATRDSYRHVVERIAKRTGRDEVGVARLAVELARAARSDERRGHVGYHLVDHGLGDLERATGYRPTPKEVLHRFVLRHPNVVFVGGMIGGTVTAIGALLWLAGAEARTAWLAVQLFALIPAIDIAVTVMNQLVTAFLPPRMLCKLDLTRQGGVPAEFRTAVVVPTLFPSVDAVREALDHLEVQYLANREAHLHFAILSDFADAPGETRPDDAAIVDAAVAGVRELNARYGGGADDLFYLFHRSRRWNARQGVWMGWERKRGKLAEFNRFLRGAAPDAFSIIVGDVAALRRVRYVITLDADTVLPPDAAPLLIGALAHPLNRAGYDPARGRVVRGYGILQPRVGVSLPSAHRSRFAAIHSGHPGVDPYTTAVSDVYQDLYGEGSFTGKGIYDVDAFEEATHGRFPENTLLSHDLIEGSYARAGLATDIIVYDEYPTRYLTYTRRKHRWIRGDWQLLRWLTARVPGPDGPEPNRLSVLSRWKILDNLRRSTVEIAQLAFLAVGWTVLPGSPLRWTVLGLGAIAAPWIVSLLLAMLRPPRDKSWRAYYAAVRQDAVTSAQQVALAITFLPHQAWISADAILRTLWRVFVSRRALLEWQTASQAERTTTGGAAAAWRTMWPAVALAGALLVTVGLVAFLAPSGAGRPWLLAAAVGPLVALWAAAPAVAYVLSKPAVRRERRLPPATRAAAMRYALLHWRFFDRFVTAETNWLAPDNFQEDPAPVVAMRTSPTNIGLQLLATVSAYDLGFVGAEEMTLRLERVLRSLERMRRFRGHFYNWYGLHDLQVLEPAYISTVDSGNLAGHLLAVRHACLAIADDPVFDGRLGRALATAIALAREHLRGSATSGAASAAADALRGAAVALEAAAEAPTPGALGAVAPALHRAREVLESGYAPAEAEPAREWIAWSLRLVAERRAGLAGVEFRPAAGRGGRPLARSETLRELAARSARAAELLARLRTVADRAHDYVQEMDFRFLYDETRGLFAIGYQPEAHALDNSYYDLLASEARLASFIAVAKNEIPVEHWFRLGRTLTHAAGETALVSWSGSMFEYLMPALVMRSFPFTLLDQTYEGAVRRHIAYGAERGVPWGASESAYNLRDRHQTYQYRAFGVPDLALKRGLGRDLVVAPYASALATMVDPHRALANLAAMEKKGALGPYGFRDALDYTRPAPGRRYAVVRNYMAHHVGMGLAALTNALAGQLWQRRFHTDPLVRAVELLLHERVPRRLVLQETQTARADEALPDLELERPLVRELDTCDTPQPHVALLGQLPYTIMVSHCGAGYSRYEDLAVTRWRADGTRDNTGQFCYVQDLSNGRVWSAGHQPVCAPPDGFRAFLATDRVTLHRADGDIETRTEIAVVPADAAEVRRVTVTNNGSAPRELQLTSYGEIVLAPPDADRAHPAFGNLFIETEWHEWCTAVTATRRPRSAEEQPLWCVHVAATGPERVGPVTCETDRARFVGRGRTTRDPVALDSEAGLSGATGAVLDPIFALRARVRVAPGQSASVAFTTLVATSLQRAFELADRYHDPYAAQRGLDLAWTATQVELRELGITPADAAVFQEIAGQLFYPNPLLRAPPDELRRNRGSQPLLWAAGISGDWPILLATIDSADGLPTLRQLLTAHHYWRRRGMTVDLVVLNAHVPGYLQELQEKITAALSVSSEAELVDRPGGVFARRQELLGAAAVAMLRATARVHVYCDGRSVGRIVGPAAAEGEASDATALPSPPRVSERPTAAALRSLRWVLARTAGAAPARPRRRRTRAGAAGPSAGFTNGFGRLTPEGDYEIRVDGDRVPPAPWANVVANPRGGFVVTERGAGFTWAESSYLFRLTPWHNDPVSDPPGDVIYLRDEDSGAVWSPTPGPLRHEGAYTVRHAPGTSSFTHQRDGLATTLLLGLAESEAVKLSLLSITNVSDRPRRLTATAFVEWTLGVLREHTQHQVQTAFDREHEAILARNFFDPQFAGQVAFCGLSAPLRDHTADRREFVGRNGTLAAPAALNAPLAGTTGAGVDPCAALRCALELAPGETRELVVVLGAAEGDEAARRALAEYRDPERAKAAIARTAERWADRLSVITVRTPEPSFDVMVNRWSLYQALACRMWARSALYQSSGAYGFRDQLQDAMALVYAEPAIARNHILRAAGRQFVEGDVQHWWHPPSGRGVRTRFSDDLVWLPYVVDHYVRVTGDASVLGVTVPFLAMRPLEPHEPEVYDVPQASGELGSVYEHCLRALRRACTAGPHGLPLIGAGDWNDGMNRVGVEGRGESVWLAWFLVATLRAFGEHARARGDTAVVAELRAQADAYAAAVEAHGWDGDWYRRAYFDDGTPLGSAVSDECRIDSIAQSWSVISRAGNPARQAQAMRSLEALLVREDARIILLLSPPFDRTPHDPGYIKGYLPGVRENGAQYTHAALWAVLATALLGKGDRAFQLFQMLNPLTHAGTPEDVAVYKVEPYVVAADVYTAAGHLGRGGWTWYTGSASWMYRVGLEAILGFTKRGATLFLDPRVPAAWPEFTIEYRYGRSLYLIVVRRPHALQSGMGEVRLDGRLLEASAIPLVDDGLRHSVVVSPREPSA